MVLLHKRRFSALVFGLVCCATFLRPQQTNAQIIMSLLFGDNLNSDKNIFGIHLNESLNSISNYEDGKSLATFNMGLFFSHKMDEKWMLNFEMMAKYKRGTKGLEAYSLDDENLNALLVNSEVSKKINYLSVPISARYFYHKQFYVEAGPQVSMRLGAFDIFESETGDDHLEYKKDIRDQLTKFDFSVLAGLGLMIGKERVDALGIRYYGGLSDILKDSPERQSHQQWAFYVNLPIGRGKMKQ